MEKKTCETCRWDYDVCPAGDEMNKHCKPCSGYSSWQAREPKQPGVFKVGDRVWASFCEKYGKLVRERYSDICHDIGWDAVREGEKGEVFWLTKCLEHA